MICNIKQNIIEVGCRNIDECPTPSAHARMNEAHRMWHQAEANYDDPDGFRANLNACIQALRNVTFVIQKEKTRIPDFEKWYPIWQDKLKKDHILKWLVEARNVIVKEGDLQTQSRVRAAILSSYFGSPYYEMNVEPMIPTKDIAAIMASQNIPIQLMKNGILRVERKWVSIDLPEHELLAALSHSYGVLSTMISAAHSQSKAVVPQVYVRHKNGKVEPYEESITHLNGCLPCMVVATETRAVRLKLSTNEFLTPSTFKLKKIPKKEIIKRYGHLFDHTSKPRDKREMAMLLLDWAKTILRTDGYHVPIVFIELKSRKYKLFTFAVRDQSEKYLIANKLARDVEIAGAKSIMAIGEAWSVLSNENKFLQRPIEEIPERSEVLAVDYISSDGEEFSLHCIFSRREDSIEFGEVVESPQSNNIFYIPVREAWRRKKRLENIKKPLTKYNIDRNALCPCQSGKKYKKCCASHIGTNLMDSAEYLYFQKKYVEAEEAFRAFLTQYIIWYNSHTVPFVRHNPKEAHGILVIDIEAVGSIIDKIASCLLYQSKKDEIDPFLERTLDIIDDSRYRVTIEDIRRRILS